MSFRLLALVAALSLPACGGGGGGGGGGGEGDGGPAPVEDNPTQVLIEPRAVEDLVDLETETGAHVVGAVPGTTYYLVDCPPGEGSGEFHDALEHDDRFTDVELDAGAQLPEGGLSTLPLFGDEPISAVATQTALGRIGRATAVGRATGEGVLVAVIDTGVVATHPLLAGHVEMGFDFIGNDEDPTDEANGLDDDLDGLVDEGYGHGTFVASLILAVAPGSRILAIRALDSDARSTSAIVAHAIAYAREAGAHVINLSLGIQADVTLVRQAIRSAQDAGIPVFAAAGNRQSAVDFPAILSEVTAVTAVDDMDRRAEFASFGSSVDLSAPGVNILGAHPAGPSGTARWSGTSFSTAFATGAYALVRQQRPEMVSSDRVKRILDTARRIDFLNPAYADRLGKGRLDLAAVTFD